MPSKPFIVAEISANHLGSMARAFRLVDAAKWAGADAVKFQTFTVKGLVADPDAVLSSGPWAGRSLGDLYAEAMTPRSWHQPLFEYARSISIEPFSTPFTPDDVDFLEELGCPRYKIASFELVDHELISYATRTGKPMVMSTGMATEWEIGDAVHAARGCQDLTLLKCTSAYPATPADANLAAGAALGGYTFGRIAMGTKWGLSDHTLGIAVPVAATALGAVMIEKHLTLRRKDGGPDAAFSLEPEEFKAMVDACRDAAAAIGEVKYGPTASEAPQVHLRGRTVRARAKA
jgi:sialic acid synthase SpsE